MNRAFAASVGRQPADLAAVVLANDEIRSGQPRTSEARVGGDMLQISSFSLADADQGQT